jgi:hypothetical protein
MPIPLHQPMRLADRHRKPLRRKKFPPPAQPEPLCACNVRWARAKNAAAASVLGQQAGVRP